MDMDVEGTTLLYAVGALFGAFAAIYFGRTFFFGLSTATKAFLLLFAFAAFIAVGLVVTQSLLTTILYLLAAASYVSFFIYSVAAFRLSTDQVFLLLAASSVLFVSLGYLIREERLDPDWRQARVAVGVIAVLAVGLTVLDATGPQPTYETSFRDTFTLVGDRVVGTVTARNGFFLPREIDLPRYDVCLYRNGTVERGRVSYEGSTSLLSGGATASFNMSVRVAVRGDEPSMADSYRVERRDSCPDQLDGRQLVVTPAARQE